jgi:glycosyltransferase involved in cell wall biosynthesis
MNRKISIAIPHYNNASFMIETLNSDIVNDDRITEIIICDDNSNDIHQLEHLLASLNCKKVKLFKNEQNLGCYHNKLNTVSKCTNEWTVLLDSDNIIDTKYIDILFNIDEWNINTIYAPAWAYTFPGAVSANLNYSKFQNQIFNKYNYLNNFSDIVFKCLINTCNYFLPVRAYSKVMHKYIYDRNIIDSLDSAVLFTDWLCDNNNIFVVNNLMYKHRLHPHSNYVVSNSKKYTTLVENNLILKITNSLTK